MQQTKLQNPSVKSVKSIVFSKYPLICFQAGIICNIFTARCYAEQGYVTVCRPSVRMYVCLSVCL